MNFFSNCTQDFPTQRIYSYLKFIPPTTNVMRIITSVNIYIVSSHKSHNISIHNIHHINSHPGSVEK